MSSLLLPDGTVSIVIQRRKNNWKAEEEILPHCHNPAHSQVLRGKRCECNVNASVSRLREKNVTISEATWPLLQRTPMHSGYLVERSCLHAPWLCPQPRCLSALLWTGKTRRTKALKWFTPEKFLPINMDKLTLIFFLLGFILCVLFICASVYHLCNWCPRRGNHIPWNWNETPVEPLRGY